MYSLNEIKSNIQQVFNSSGGPFGLFHQFVPKNHKIEGEPLGTIKNFQKISQCRKHLKGGNENEINDSLHHSECFSAGRCSVVSAKSVQYAF